MFKTLGSIVSVFDSEESEAQDKAPIKSGVLISITADGIFIIMEDSGHCFCAVPEFSRIHIEYEEKQSAAVIPAKMPKFDSENKKQVIKYMKKLRTKGGTYLEIANHLNRNKIKTFSGSGKWFAQTIHRLCASK